MKSREISPSGRSPLDELDGYLELGIHRKVRALARRILRDPRLTDEAFSKAVHALLGVQTKLQGLVPLVEKAYRRLKIRERRNVRFWMLSFYYSLNDYSKALGYTTMRPIDGADFMLCLEILARSGKENEARRLANRGLCFLASKKDTGNCSSVWGGLADYFTRNGDWDKALELWQEAPGQTAYDIGKVESIAKLHAARGLVAIHEAFRELDLIEKNGCSDLAISHPG